MPVLSKAHTPILPPKGILKGSVQKILFFWRYKSDVFTEIVKIIGSSGGTTVVIIRMQRIKSLFLSREPSSKPFTNTYPEEMQAKINKTKIKTKASVCFICKFSLLNKTVLINLPLDVSNPVFKATAIQSSV